MQVYDIPLDDTHQETTKHGNNAFPFAIYTTTINKNILGYIDWHWHHELQFCMVLEGEVDFYVNQSQFLLKKGEGIFINTEQLHMAKNHEKHNSTYICLDFHPRMISSFDHSIVETKYVQPYLKKKDFSYCLLFQDVQYQKQILDLIHAISQEYHSQDRDEMHIFIQLMTLWHILIQHYQTSETINTMNPHVKKMMDYIRHHYSENIGLDDIAQHVTLARSTCCREFKQQMGYTLFEYLLNVRLQEASRLLLSTDSNITEISILCGFSNSSYFTKEFKRKTGLTPTSYRKEKEAERIEILSTI